MRRAMPMVRVMIAAAACVAPAPAFADSTPRPGLAELPVSGFDDAVISVPAIRSGKKPIVVAVHGHRFRADWECRNAREVFGDRAFVLCPRGVKAPARGSDYQDRYTFKGVDAVQREIDAGVAALAAAYPGYVDLDQRVYYGHSLGAYLGISIVSRAPDKWPLAIFHEGGWGWSTAAARVFKKRGGRRIVIACGTPECAAWAKNSIRALDAGGVGARLVESQESGHHNFGPIIDAIADSVPWLLDGDARFGG